MVCGKLDLQFLCVDNPGVRCVNVPAGKCKPKPARQPSDKAGKTV